MNFSFDLEKIQELFKEVQLFFPDQLAQSYEELVALNDEMSSGRKARLRQTKKKLLIEREQGKSKHSEYSKQQQQLTKILLQKDSFAKYKQLQHRLIKEETNVAVLRERLKKIDIASELSGRLEEAEGLQKTAATELELETRIRDNEQLKRAVQIFDDLVSNILSIAAYFYPETNSQGNLDFRIKLKDQTSVNDGFSYTRVLSAIFDATLLLLYANEDFYKFVYHDGLLESLDDRIKLKLLNYWRKLGNTHGLQLIISVLDSDLPLDADKKQYFKETEIIRELHDRGDDGRLFKMPAF